MEHTASPASKVIPLTAACLRIDARATAERIEEHIRQALAGDLHRRGIVVGISGGIDSSVTAALAARAVGRKRVLGLEMPERDSADDTLALSGLLADHLGIRRHREDISAPLSAVGFYTRYREAVRRVVPEYGEGWRSKIVSEQTEGEAGFRVFFLVALGPDGETLRRRLPLQAYLEIVAASNFKQRLRKMFEYYHADRLHYAVAGTPNRLEYDQGFFVKGGDGASDLKPIAHLYKTQVYQLADYLGIPEEIRRRPPTTDTYSLAQGQDEFYFSLPYGPMDLCLYGRNHQLPPETVAAAAGLEPRQVLSAYRDIDRKRATTRYLHLAPLLVEPVSEIS